MLIYNPILSLLDWLKWWREARPIHCQTHSLPGYSISEYSRNEQLHYKLPTFMWARCPKYLPFYSSPFLKLALLPKYLKVNITMFLKILSPSLSRCFLTVTFLNAFYFGPRHKLHFIERKRKTKQQTKSNWREWCLQKLLKTWFSFSSNMITYRHLLATFGNSSKVRIETGAHVTLEMIWSALCVSLRKAGTRFSSILT